MNNSMNNIEKYTNSMGRNQGRWTTYDRIADYYGLDVKANPPKFLSRNPKYELPYNKNHERYLKIREEIKTPSKEITFTGELKEFIIEARKRLHLTVIIGTPDADGYGWTHTTHLMTQDEYYETKKNLAGTSCSISKQ